MNGTRQKILGKQLLQTLAAEGRGEALDAEAKGPNHSWRSQHPKARPWRNN